MEVVMWTALRHPNVLSLMGVMITTDNQLAMVTEWMVNGNVNEFVKVNKDADRLELVRFPLEVVLLHFLLTTARTPSWETSVGAWTTYTAKT